MCSEPHIHDRHTCYACCSGIILHVLYSSSLSETTHELGGRFAWSIWYLTDIEGGAARTSHTTCSSYATDELADGDGTATDPVDPRLLGTWTCELVHAQNTQSELEGNISLFLWSGSLPFA